MKIKIIKKKSWFSDEQGYEVRVSKTGKNWTTPYVALGEKNWFPTKVEAIKFGKSYMRNH